MDKGQNFQISLGLDGAISTVIKKQAKKLHGITFLFFLQCRVLLFFCKEEFTLEPNIGYKLTKLSNNRYMALATKVNEVRLVY